MLVNGKLKFSSKLHIKLQQDLYINSYEFQRIDRSVTEYCLYFEGKSMDVQLRFGMGDYNERVKLQSMLDEANVPRDFAHESMMPTGNKYVLFL